MSDIVITTEYLKKHTPSHGGWTRSQFAALGINGKPKKGWKKAVIGRKMTLAQQRSFEAPSARSHRAPKTQARAQDKPKWSPYQRPNYKGLVASDEKALEKAAHTVRMELWIAENPEAPEVVKGRKLAETNRIPLSWAVARYKKMYYNAAINKQILKDPKHQLALLRAMSSDHKNRDAQAMRNEYL